MEVTACYEIYEHSETGQTMSSTTLLPLVYVLIPSFRW